MHKFSMKAVAVAAVIGGAMAGAVSASAALNLPTQNCGFQFNTNMKLGSRGVDVQNLQKVLNAYPQTQVAVSGAGSPGNETTYFGAATRAAVNKLHALHLVELGITAPTGNVFAGTRGLLNALCAGGNAGQGNNGNGNGGNVVTGPVSAMLGASQPTGLLVQGQSGARLADIAFSGNGTVTSVELQRTGVSTDSTLTNVYLYDGNTRITDAASVVTGGYIRFNNPNGLFSVNGARTITVRADIAGSTQGQSVGVKLNSVTAGGSVSSYSNVMGNSLQIANVDTATVNFATLSNSSTVKVDAGTTNYIVWSGSATVSTRDVNLRAASFKFVGSAPVDAIANLSLYVDGTKVAGPAAINAANNNKVTFDLGNMAYVLKTGSHTIEVRGDIVKGSNRTFTFSIENVADLMLEDSSLAGVNVSAKVNNGTLTQTNTSYNSPITINKGSVTVNADPAFNATKVTGGATNVPVGQFTLKAYGEDVKVNTLQVDFNMTTATSVNNVSLYVNGGQVGTSQNYRGSALSYTLGSSLIIPANTSVTLTVKADVVDANNAAWTAGTIKANIGGVASNAQGQSSNELVDVAASAVSGNTLTISSGAGTFARATAFNAVSVSPNTPNVKIGSFTLQANSAEAIKINSISVNPIVSGSPYTITNLSNLTLKSGSMVLGTPVGNPASGTTTFSFSDVTIPANGSMTFDVYADVGSATSGNVSTDMAVTYRGVISNTTTTSSAAGVAVTSAASTLATPTKSSQSTVAQFVVGGSTFGIASFNVKTSAAGTSATIREMRFTSSASTAIESVTVGGVTAPMVAGTSTVTGLNITVGSTGTDVPVTVKLAGYQDTTSGGSLSTTVGNVTLSLTYIEATSGTGTVIPKTTIVAGNTMVHVASKPTISVGAGNTDTLVLGSENKVGEFTVTADANGKIAVGTTSLDLSINNTTGGFFNSYRVADGNTNITGATVATTTATNAVITFSPTYEIAPGQSKTFSVYAYVGGTGVSGTTPYVASRLTSASSFVWYDVAGGYTGETGANILNFPTSSFTTKR